MGKINFSSVFYYSNKPAVMCFLKILCWKFCPSNFCILHSTFHTKFLY